MDSCGLQPRLQLGPFYGATAWIPLHKINKLAVSICTGTQGVTP